MKGDSVRDRSEAAPGAALAGVAGKKSGNWKDLRARVLSAAVLVPCVALCVWAGGLLYGALIVLAMAGMAMEWARLFGFGLETRRGQLCLAWAACVGGTALAGHWGGALLVMVAAVVLGPALWAGQVAIGCAGLSLLWLRYMSEPGAGVVLFLVACVALSDTGAYMTGRVFGGPKLAPRISPAKTWSGSIGGMCCAVLGGMLIAAMLPGALPGAVWRGALFGGLVAIAAQIGDLGESALKRACNVKDSGTILPGHGGLLDRFDGLLVAAPMAALLSLGAAGGIAFWYVGLH
uniref:phosphatidate cytidylyltransferase n=1 Tax=Komagataeibacter xylinus TaxID=28448 RepID=UPI0035B5657D